MRGALPDRRARLEAQGIRIFPQDGSAIRRDITHLVVTTAIAREMLGFIWAIAQSVQAPRAI